MNDKDFLKNNCNRCMNKLNKEDLCSIVKRINGTYGCPNEDCIEINDYIRNEDGYIGIVKKILLPDEKMESTYFVCDTTMASAYLEEIKKHSKDILDLIETGDVLEVEEDGDVVYMGIKQDTTTLSYSDIKESIRNKEIKLLRILTHEQFEENSFEVMIESLKSDAILFGKRKELENKYKEWTQNFNVSDSAFNVITFLEAYDLLNRKNINKFLEEKKNENKF